MFNKKRALKYPAKVRYVTSGTGTETGWGIITVVASNTATAAYLTVASGTNIGTLVGTL
jgi:hypothetical protein